jgi:hypothetical protein
MVTGACHTAAAAGKAPAASIAAAAMLATVI